MKHKLLVQDNALTTARYEMTSLEKNIMYAVMSQIEDADEPTKFYPITVTDIAELTKRRVRNDDFKDAIQRLLTRDFTITDSGGYLQSTFISSAYYDNRGFVEIGIDLRLRPYLFALKKNFTTFGIEAATALNSKYSKRLYEMLCQFRHTGLFRISVKDLKERFCLVNKDGTEKLEQWVSFENRILKTAQEEINEKADIKFDYILKRTGRKITDVEFVFRKPTPPTPELESVPAAIQTVVEVAPTSVVAPTGVPRSAPTSLAAIKHARMLERLKDYGLQPAQVNKVLAKNTKAVINKTLYDLDCNRDGVKNPAAYLLKLFNVL